jgi:hypothetical protein
VLYGILDDEWHARQHIHAAVEGTIIDRQGNPSHMTFDTYM